MIGPVRGGNCRRPGGRKIREGMLSFDHIVVRACCVTSAQAVTDVLTRALRGVRAKRAPRYAGLNRIRYRYRLLPDILALEHLVRAWGQLGRSDVVMVSASSTPAST